jgi:hypothetical protein
MRGRAYAFASAVALGAVVLGACTQGTTPDCSGDAGVCGAAFVDASGLDAGAIAPDSSSADHADE